MVDTTYTGITPADVTGYRDRLNKLLGTDQISGVWTPPKSPITYASTPTLPQSFQSGVSPTGQVISAPATTPAVATPPITTPPAVAPTTVTPPAKVTTPSAYTGGSIVDYLSSTGKPSDFASRATLAKNAGIANYTGSAEQNTQLLNTLRGGAPAVATPATTTTSPAGAPTVTTQTGTTPTADELARQKALKKQAELAGSAGLSLDDWTKTQMPTAEESANIAKELGITTLEGEVFKKPTKTSQEIYDTAYSTSGLADIKAQIMKINEEVNKSREELRVGTGKIDENPFLTETSRVGRGKRLLAQYEAKITNQLDQATRLQGLYDKGIEEINKIITRNATDFGVNQTIDQAKLNYLQKKAEVEATKLTAKRVTEGLPSYLSGKTAGQKPEVIGGQDTGYFKWDPTLKKFIQVVPASTKSTTATFNPTADQKSLVGRFVNSSMSKDLNFSAEDKARLTTDSNFFYWALQKATEAGMY